ncbi:chemotaxis protein CheX [Desulfopila sp. IMCC35008]|uniref:chemotaxis protein CheX n=1 Tax=Desulfopila sp. IMCC35008 TaxID=2653858 RepID=UPI0013D01D92|nr:chemotaxis protein CheX [Desulfopila sp. IMCC35008]
MEIRNRIIESAQEIFSTMIMMEVAVSDKEVSGSMSLVDSISGVIGLAGTHKGVLAIHLPIKVAMGITSSFLGMDVDEVNEDVEDAVGELANMLGGNLKTILSENGRDIDLSLPTTISGKEYEFQSSRNADKERIHLSCDAGDFSIELQLEQ